MTTTISYTPRGYQNSSASTAPNYPEEKRIVDAVQTAVTTLATFARTRSVRVPLKLTANSTWASYLEIPEGGTVTAIALVTPTVFATGTITLAVKKTNSSGNTMLSAATYDLTAASANTRTAMTLTSTAADLAVSANGLVYVAIVSNNGSATGPADGAAFLTVTYLATAP
jgi:hypothetical protein